MRSRGIVLPLILGAFLACPFRASGAAITIVVDEYGNGIGTNGAGYLSNLDAGPGALPNVLTYNLPFAGVQGDFFMIDTAPAENGLISDLLRFDGAGHLFFYSDIRDGADSPADIGIPAAFYANQASVTEQPNFQEAPYSYAIFTPVIRQPSGSAEPGYNNAAQPVTYTFVSEGTVPEPSTLTLTLLGVLSMLAVSRYVAKRATQGRAQD